MKSILSILAAAVMALACSSAMGQTAAAQPEPVLSSVEVLRTVPYFTGNTILSPQPLSINTLSTSTTRQNVLSCPVTIAQRPQQPAPQLPSVAYSPPVTVTEPYALSYVSPQMMRIQPLVSVPGGYMTYGYGPYVVPPAVNRVGPIYPETPRFLPQSPLPYGYVGVSPLFSTGTVVRVVP